MAENCKSNGFPLGSRLGNFGCKFQFSFGRMPCHWLLFPQAWWHQTVLCLQGTKGCRNVRIISWYGMELPAPKINRKWQISLSASGFLSKLYEAIIPWFSYHRHARYHRVFPILWCRKIKQNGLLRCDNTITTTLRICCKLKRQLCTGYTICRLGQLHIEEKCIQCWKLHR